MTGGTGPGSSAVTRHGLIMDYGGVLTDGPSMDDLPRNVRGAREAGAVGVLHDDPGATVAEVEILLDLPG
jgi:hypothetical protein